MERDGVIYTTVPFLSNLRDNYLSVPRKFVKQFLNIYVIHYDMKNSNQYLKLIVLVLDQISICFNLFFPLYTEFFLCIHFQFSCGTTGLPFKIFFL
jgi:hypothetical protein